MIVEGLCPRLLGWSSPQKVILDYWLLSYWVYKKKKKHLLRKKKHISWEIPVQSLSRPPEITVKIARIFLGEHAWVPECDEFSHTINNYPMEGTIQNGTIFLGGLFYGVSFTHSFFEVQRLFIIQKEAIIFHKLVLDFHGNRLIHLKLNWGPSPRTEL